MNSTQVKCFLVMMVFVLIGFGPLSLTCLIGLFVVSLRPRWFFDVVQNLYRGIDGGQVSYSLPPQGNCAAANIARIKTFLCLLALLLLDIAPVPVTGSIGLYVIIMRPQWFKALVEKIYCGADASQTRNMA